MKCGRSDILWKMSAPAWVPFFLAWLMGQVAVDLAGDVLRGARRGLSEGRQP